jgi:TPR repeat protein
MWTVSLCLREGHTVVHFYHNSEQVCTFVFPPADNMSSAERRCVVGCLLRCRLVRLLSSGVGHHFEPQENRRACHQMMQIIASRIAAGLTSVIGYKVGKAAEKLCASGQYAAAVVPLQRAIDFGNLPSLALKAWLLIKGRIGVPRDETEAFRLVQMGAAQACAECKGVMACCYQIGAGCIIDAAQSLVLALESSDWGCRYGYYALGMLYHGGEAGLVQNYVKAGALYQLAADKGLDEAQCKMGDFSYYIEKDFAKALRYYELAATQGYYLARLSIDLCHQNNEETI